MQILGGHYSAYGSTLDYLIWGGEEGSHQNLTEVPGGMDLTGSHLLLSSP